MKKLLFFSLILVCCFPAFSQQIWWNGFFSNNFFLVNPAQTALNEQIRVNAQYGIYNFSYQSQLKEYQLTGQCRLPSINSALGVSASHSNWGEWGAHTSNFSMSYAYRHWLGKTQKYRMSYGVNAGFNQLFYRNSLICVPYMAHINLGAGAVFSAANDKWMIGLSSTNLARIIDSDNPNYSPLMAANIQGGYRWDLRKGSIQHNIQIGLGRYNPGTFFSTHYNYKWLNVGVGTHNLSSLFASAQITLKQHWQLGYMYLYSLSGFNTIRNSNPFFFSLSYRMK